MSVRILEGDCLATLRTLPAASVQCCVTSPPYWGGLRDYGCVGQLGLERAPVDYVGAMVGVFAEVRRVLRTDATLWLNVGDVYAASGKGGGGLAGDRAGWATIRERKGFRMPPPGYKMKDLTLVAFQLADALRQSGWYLRSTIVWRKPAAVEPTRADRPAVSHEYLFLLSASEHYRCASAGEPWWHSTVWDVPVEPVPGHPAAMPAELARRCIITSTDRGDTVLDPFAGAGTTGMAADRLGRHALLLELNPDYAALARARLIDDAPLLAVVA